MVEKEKILVVDEDPEVIDLLLREILTPVGYSVSAAGDVSTALQETLNFGPDLIIASLTLPGLSGKDFLVALQSQIANIPMIVTAPAGMEADAIQAFRLGACDYLVKPIREAEVIAAVGRALRDTHLRLERDQLLEQLAESNRQLERRVQELTTLFGLGKTVTSTTHQGQLFAKLIEGSLFITDADIGWILLQSDDSTQLVLRAEKNLPAEAAARMHKPWDDGISSLVLLSGEPLNLHGEGLNNSRLAAVGRSALIVPITVRDQPIGVICVARKAMQPFTERQQVMLEAVSDYASISLVNARLFQALEERAKQLEREIAKPTGVRDVPEEWIDNVNRTLRASISEVIHIREGGKAVKANKELSKLEADLETLLEEFDWMISGKRI